MTHQNTILSIVSSLLAGFSLWRGNAPFWPTYMVPCAIVAYNLALYTQQGTIESGGLRLQTPRQTGRLHSFCNNLLLLIDRAAGFVQLVTRLPEEWHYVGLISPEHAIAKFPNELHNYQKFLHHCRCVFSHSSLYFFPPHNFSPLVPKPFNFYLFHPPHPPLLELSHPRHQTPSLTRPHPPPHLSPFFTPLRISSLAIKTYSFPVVVLIRLPPSSRLFPFPHILPSTSLSPPFDFN